MKHTVKVTLALVIFFFTAQLAGLLVIDHYIDHKKTIEAKEIVYKPLPYGFERPEVKNQSTSFIYITIAILIGTGMLLLITRMNAPFLWKILFFISMSVSLAVAFAAFLNAYIAGMLAIATSFLRLYRPNIIVHNLSEIFIYGGLAAIMVNIFNLFAVFMLLIVISLYDYLSVYITKHMIRLAKFQSETKVFAGMLIPYSVKNANIKKIASSPAKISQKSRVAILGGGDIGFPLIFAGVVMKGLMLQETFIGGFLKTLIIPFCVSIALLVLLVKGKQNKFYPAMPVLSLGCFIGYIIVLLV